MCSQMLARDRHTTSMVSRASRVIWEDKVIKDLEVRPNLDKEATPTSGTPTMATQTPHFHSSLEDQTHLHLSSLEMVQEVKMAWDKRTWM